MSNAGKLTPAIVWLYLHGTAAALTETLPITLCHIMKQPKQRYKVYLLLAVITLLLSLCTSP